MPSSRISSDPSDSQLLLFSSPHSSSTGFRLENTWHEIRDHSFIQNLSRSFRFTASNLQFTSLILYRVQVREHLTRDQRSFLHPESLQIHIFSSSVHSLIFYRVQVREHLTRDQRPFLHSESLQILQIHIFFSSVHLTHLLQGSGQRTPDTRSETIPSSRISPDLQIRSFFSSVHSLIFYRVQVRGHLTRDQRPFLHPESLQILQIHSFSSSVHLTHPLQGSGQRTPDTRSETIPSSRISLDLQIRSFFSSVHSLIFYRVQVRGHLTRDQRPFLHPESLQILQIHSFSSSVHLTHPLQGSGQRTPDTRSETIPSSRITPDLQIHSFFSSVHSSYTGFRLENTWHEIRDIPSSRITPDLQIHSFSSSVHLTHLLQGSGQRTPDTRSETIPSSRITPDLQIHSFSSSVHLTHPLQGSGQRTPDTRSETIPSSRISPDLQIHSFSSSVHLTHLLQSSGQRTGMAIAEAWFCAQWPIFVLFLRFMF